MKKAAILGERQAGLVEVPDPQPKEDWAVVKINAAPMCTEYHAFERGHKSDNLGHDAAGKVAFVGQSGRNDTVIHVSPDLISKGLTLIGAWHYNLNDFPSIMKVVQGSSLLDLLVSHVMPMSQIQEAFEISASHQSAKIILKPWE